MGFRDITSRDAVREAIDELDAVGEQAFLDRYGFRRSRSVRLVVDGKDYPAKAILGASHGYEFPQAGPLAPSTFSSGAPTVRKLESLGFEVRDLTATDVDLTALLEAALVAVRERRSDAIREAIGQRLTTALRGLLAGRSVSAGTGIGTAADVPWVGAYPLDAPPTAQQGVYAVYLFAYDGSAVYLSFNQGTENLRGGARPLRKRALDMRAAAGITDPGDAVELRSSNSRPRAYEAGNAFAIRYDAAAVPDTATLLRDLRTVLSYVERAVASGLTFDPTREPLHLIFKWSPSRSPDTFEAARAFADKHSYVWWKKLGSEPISARHLTALREQLEDGVATSVYLYGERALARARLTELTDDPDQVPAADREAVPPNDPATLFARLTDLETVPLEGVLDHLLLASSVDADPARLERALGTQTNPLFVYERFTPRPSRRSMPASTSTLDQLAEQTLWPKADLEELLDALDPATGRGQVILAGPPGTGKTWIATAVARHLTAGASSRIGTVQFHPSYGYEEFVEGIRPVARNGGIVFEAVRGTVLRIADAIEQDDELRVLVVDELNRANIPRVFGELLYLLEYRNQEITLQYSERFSLPSKLRLIATMNTADRSVRSIDVALRRRFEVFECPPDHRILEQFYACSENVNDVGDLVEGFEALNAALASELDRHHTIGHSFFMAARYDWARLERTWRRQIKPLVEDYFFDRPELVAEFTLTRFWTPSQ